jgi:hypothetical protein
MIGKKAFIYPTIKTALTCHFIPQNSLEKSKRAINDVSLTEKKVYKAYAVYKPQRAADRAPAGYL